MKSCVGNKAITPKQSASNVSLYLPSSRQPREALQFLWKANNAFDHLFQSFDTRTTKPVAVWTVLR